MSFKISRRGIIQRTMVAGALSVAGLPLAVENDQNRSVNKDTVRDRFWLFAAPTNSDFPNLGRRSTMSPAEGAYYLSIPNIIMVQAGGEEAKYGRFDPPFAQYTIALQPFNRVLWSITASGGVTSMEERDLAFELAKTTPNLAGFYMDDFFEAHGTIAALSLDQLGRVREQLRGLGHDLKLWVTLYTRQLDLPIADYLRQIDVITLWTSKPSDLANLDPNLRKVEQLAPQSKRALGCYMVDYGAKKSVPVAAMKEQCEAGLKWLRKGRIEAMVFLGNTVEDLGFEAVAWTREWIRRVGETKL
jgi:hypothetical protein